MNPLICILLAMLFILMDPIETMAIEQAKYSIVSKSNNIEIRDYPPSVVAETVVAGSLEEAGSKAFRRLFGYISGDNRSRNKVAMTAPVSQRAKGAQIEMTAPVGLQPSKEKWAVSFMMPASYTMETLPTPDDPEVYLRQIPTRRMVAIRYSGAWSKRGYSKNKLALEAWINENGLKIVGDPLWARYNSPFTPWFLRRNEILFPIEKTD